MLKQRYALYAPEDDGASGGGAAGGDLEGGDQDESGSKDVVPKSQMIAAINSATDKMERALAAQRSEFEARLAAAVAPKTEAPKEYTRAELNALVSDGKISQDQADAQIDLQIGEKARTTAERVARETVNQTTQAKSVSEQINQYVAMVPELRDKGSETYQKVAAEFTFLRDNGDDPRSLSTELKAIRAALGPLDTLTKARSGKSAHEGHRETGDGGGAGSRGGQGNLKMSERERAHYAPRVGPGKLYADWKAVEKELARANPETRRKHGAPV